MEMKYIMAFLEQHMFGAIMTGIGGIILFLFRTFLVRVVWFPVVRMVRERSRRTALCFKNYFHRGRDLLLKKEPQPADRQVRFVCSWVRNDIEGDCMRLIENACKDGDIPKHVDSFLDCSTVSLKSDPQGREKRKEELKKLMEKRKAQLALAGEVEKDGKRVHLWFESLEKEEDGTIDLRGHTNAYPLENGRLDGALREDLRKQILLRLRKSLPLDLYKNTAEYYIKQAESFLDKSLEDKIRQANLHCGVGELHLYRGYQALKNRQFLDVSVDFFQAAKKNFENAHSMYSGRDPEGKVRAGFSLGHACRNLAMVHSLIKENPLETEITDLIANYFEQAISNYREGLKEPDSTQSVHLDGINFFLGLSLGGRYQCKQKQDTNTKYLEEAAMAFREEIKRSFVKQKESSDKQVLLRLCFSQFCLGATLTNLACSTNDLGNDLGRVEEAVKTFRASINAARKALVLPNLEIEDARLKAAKQAIMNADLEVKRKQSFEQYMRLFKESIDKIKPGIILVEMQDNLGQALVMQGLGKFSQKCFEQAVEVFDEAIQFLTDLRESSELQQILMAPENQSRWINLHIRLADAFAELATFNSNERRKHLQQALRAFREVLNSKSFDILLLDADDCDPDTLDNLSSLRARMVEKVDHVLDSSDAEDGIKELEEMVNFIREFRGAIKITRRNFVTTSHAWIEMSTREQWRSL